MTAATLGALLAVAACGSPTPPAVGQGTASPGAAAASTTPTEVAPTEPAEAVDPLSTPLVRTPTGFRAAETVDFGFSMVEGDVLLGLSMDTGEVYRWDAGTHEALETLRVGPRGVFPPDAQSGSHGTGGVWVSLASQNAAALIDPVAGKELRRVEITGHPYDMIEVDGQLWIADFGWDEIVRYDLATDRLLATIPVSGPTDILFAEGSIWAPLHIGRDSDSAPIDGPGGQVVRIDPLTNKIVARIDAGHRPYYLAAGFDAIWTGNATSADVTRVDMAANTSTSIPIGEDGAFDIEVSGDSVWAVVGPQWPRERVCDPETSFFVRIDPDANAVRERIAFPCAGQVTPVGDDGSFWVSGVDAEGAVSRLYVPVR